MSPRRGSTQPPASDPDDEAGSAQRPPERPRRSSLGRGADADSPDTSGADETRPDDSTGAVPGERGIPTLNRVRSVQSRISTVLGVALMSVLGVGLLTWYYSGAINRTARAQQLAQAAARRRAQAESTLPPLGAIIGPQSSAPPSSTLDALIGPPPPDPSRGLAPTSPASASPATGHEKTPGELAYERRLAGPVLAASSDRAQFGRPEAGPVASDESPAQLTPTSEEGDGGEGSATQDSLGNLLKPTPMPAVRARVLPTQRFLLPKGAFIDCTLETAISSALPGMTTCITATDTFGSDGHIVLLERGSKLVGETRGQVQEGKARLFVLWTEVRTPAGVVVPLASPGTDSLGRSGLSGVIDHHWWARFGSAILITLIDGAVQGYEQSRGAATNTIVVSPSTTDQVATETLRDTLRIRPTIDIAQGERIQILVARDVDFRSVYALHVEGGQ